MVKYFQHKINHIGTISVEDKLGTAEEINQFSEKNNLEVVSLSCSGNTGIFVAFKQKSQN